jgi:hypothetical protein
MTFREVCYLVLGVVVFPGIVLLVIIEACPGRRARVFE